MHIFSIPATFVPRIRLIAQKLWKELIIQTFFRCNRQTDRQTDRVKHKGPNGPDITHLGICNNLVKISLVITEILSCSCSVLLLVKAAGDHLAVPNCKKSKWLYAKIIVPQKWYNSIETVFHF